MRTSPRGDPSLPDLLTLAQPTLVLPTSDTSKAQSRQAQSDDNLKTKPLTTRLLPAYCPLSPCKYRVWLTRQSLKIAGDTPPCLVHWVHLFLADNDHADLRDFRKFMPKYGAKVRQVKPNQERAS